MVIKAPGLKLGLDGQVDDENRLLLAYSEHYWWHAHMQLMLQEAKAGIILGLRPANERRRYKVTPSLIGWAQTQNQRCNNARDPLADSPQNIGQCWQPNKGDVFEPVLGNNERYSCCHYHWL